MENIMKNLFFVILLLFPPITYADNPHASAAHPQFFTMDGLGEGELACYSTAMIAFDSVINHRSGIRPEHALPPSHSKAGYDDQEINTAKVVLSAFHWNGSPHTYAIKTFSECIMPK